VITPIVRFLTGISRTYYGPLGALIAQSATAAPCHAGGDAYLLDIYVVRTDGVWRYEPKRHRLVFHMDGDLRGQTTTGQPFVAKAPVNFVYAFDTTKMPNATDAEKNATSGATAGVAAQNVYLYCASAGLATVFRESVPAVLAKTLRLPYGQVIQFAQSVGYPRV